MLCSEECGKRSVSIPSIPSIASIIPYSALIVRATTVDDDVRLMLSFRDGNVADFEKLMQRHQKSVLNLAHRFIGDRTAAEDMAQEVFIRIYRSAPSYQPSASFVTWMYQIVRNTCYSELRRRGRRAVRIGDDPANDPAAPPDVDHLEQSELLAAVRMAIASLPDNQRMAVILRRYQNLSYGQIARTMGTSESAVKALLHRARETLKEKLRSFADSAPRKKCD